MTLRKLCNNCSVVFHDGNTYCISYDSTIAIMGVDGSITLGKHWNYSKTTLKHLFTFIEEYDLDATKVILGNAKKTKVETIRYLITLNYFMYNESLV